MHKIALLSLCLFLTCSIVYAEELPIVNTIEIHGLKRIEEGAVKSRISQEIGEPLSQDKTNKDIKSIFKMGYFDDVKVEIEAFEGGIKLIYVVKEKPTVIKIDFQGNKKVDDSELKKAIIIATGSIADTVLIQDNALKISKFYEEKGYWLANVVPVIKKVSEDEIGLTYQIDEGTKVRIKRVIIENNKKISSRKIRKAMKTRKWGLFSFITSSGYYKKDQMESDIEKIKHLYFNNGFIKVIIADPEINLNIKKKGMTITIKVVEGDQYRISSIDFTGNKAFDNETIMKQISLSPDSIFKKNELDKDIRSISTLYSENGYALIFVTPDLISDDKNKTVQVKLNIDEGDKYRIGRIEISGNTKTRDKVIRREIRLDEGETFDSSKLRRSYERINNLNFFETVEMAPKPDYEKKVLDVEVKVKERPTGSLSVGGGYSSVDSLIATIDLTQGNLFGRGQFIKLKAELGGRSSLYEISFKDPWLFGRPISFSTGIYNTDREYIEYDKKAMGFYVGLGKDLSEYWKVDSSYKFEKATIHSIDESASVIIKDQEGTRTTSSISPSIIRDTTDNYLDPTSGSRNALYLTFAGLGGSNTFIKALVDSAWFFPLGKATFMFRGRFGYGAGIFGKELPLYERYYVGGIRTIRGLDWGEAGPRDEETGDEIGGTEELIFNTEYIFPLFPEVRLKGLLFFDTGNSYDKFNNFGALRYTAGAGVRWISPFGPIRIEWGYNLDKRPGESSNKLEFTFGSFF